MVDSRTNCVRVVRSISFKKNNNNYLPRDSGCRSIFSRSRGLQTYRIFSVKRWPPSLSPLPPPQPIRVHVIQTCVERVKNDAALSSGRTKSTDDDESTAQSCNGRYGSWFSAVNGNRNPAFDVTKREIGDGTFYTRTRSVLIRYNIIEAVEAFWCARV